MFIPSKSLETNKNQIYLVSNFAREKVLVLTNQHILKSVFFAKSFPIMFSVIVKQISVQRVQFIDRPLFVSIGLINAILKGLISPARRGAYSPTLLHSPPHTPSGNYCITGLSIIVTFRPTAFCHGYTDASRKAGLAIRNRVVFLGQIDLEDLTITGQFYCKYGYSYLKKTKKHVYSIKNVIQ